MKKDKLFHLFYSLSQKEVKAFKTFVIGRKPERISHLVEFLAKTKKKDDHQHFEKIRQKAFNKLFPNEKNNTQNFRRLVTDTLALLNDFLILQQTKEDPATRQELLREQYKSRALSNLYEAALEEAIIQLKDRPERDFHHYNALIHLLNERVYYKRVAKGGINKTERDILEIDHLLDMRYSLSKLHHAAHLKSHLLITNLPTIQFQLSDEFTSYIKPNANDPVIKLYTNIIKLADAPNEEDYYRLKSQWIQQLDLFTNNLKRQTATVLVNLCWFSINQKDKLAELYKLYKVFIEENLLVNSGYISLNSFNNFVEMATTLKKYDEARAFIIEYIPFLRQNQEQKKNIQNLYESYFLFGEGKFDQAFLKSNHLQFSRFSFGLRSYVLIIKCLYETRKAKSLPDLETRCTAFKQYLHRKYKEGLINKEKYDENVNFTKIILLLPETSTSRFAKNHPNQLLEKINNMSHLVSRPWLLEKIEALR